MTPSDRSAAIRHRHPSILRWRDLLRTRPIRLVLALEGLVALCVVLGLGVMRQQTLDGELRSLASLSAAMATQATGTLDVADATLHATRDELASGLLSPRYGRDAAHALLQSRVAALPTFRVLAVIDDTGQRIATSLDRSPSPLTLAASDFFKAAKRATPGSLFVGSPYISRADGRPAIGVSMDWRDAAGAFAGAVVLVADPEFLDGGFDRIAPTPDTSMAIYRRDRELVSDGPGDGSARLLPASSMAQLWTDDLPQRARLMDLPDGSTRLVAAHRLQRYPLMVVITRDTGAVLADWNEQAWLVGSFAASALIVTFLLTLRNAREQGLRRLSDAALAAEQQRAVRAFQAAREGHWEWNPVSRQTHLSPRMCELLGVGTRPDGAQSIRTGTGTGDDALQRPGAAQWIDSAVHPDDRRPLREAFAAHQSGRTPAFDCSFRVRHADGQWHHVQARGHAWRDAGGATLLFSGTAVDVTDAVEGLNLRHRLEAQLARASKLEALGTLAGGVAHDFNNILAAVIGYAELARDRPAADARQTQQLDRVLQAGQRGKALVARILSSSRGLPHAHRVMRIQPVVDEVLLMLAASMPDQVRVQSQLDAADAAIVGDPTLVHEALMNLCTNAVQAMPAGGTLQVRLSVDVVSVPTHLYAGTLAPGAHVCVAVSDSGAGIADDVMARLFEPFFTTRGRQQGTGLGLAVVRGVVADLGGAIDVLSEPGRGACFTLYFPLSTHPANGPADAMGDDDERVPLGQGERVLVIDDEPALMELAEELLAGMGYEAAGMTSSTGALARFRADPDRFDLVLTDELMPEMTGTALTAALHAIRPGLPVVLASGYGGPHLESRAAAVGISVLVQKPLRRADLARAVARALAQGEATVATPRAI